MSCSTMCGCANPVGTLFKPKKQETFIGCVVDDFYFDESTGKAVTEGEYIVPRSGWYVGYVASHGADISRTMIYYPQGTNTICNYYEAGEKIKYQLGSNSKLQNKTGEWVEAGAVSGLQTGKETFNAKAVFQYLGKISEPVLILTDKGFREGVGKFAPFLIGTPFEGQARVQEPQLTDVVYHKTGAKTFSYFSVTEFTVTESKTYLVGSAGDDYANVYIDGKPAAWLAKNNKDRSLLTVGKGLNSAYQTLLVNEVYLEAGTHTLVLWNCSPICCNISGIVAVKDPDTNAVYAYDTQYKYIRSEVDCLGEVAATKFKFKADNDYDQFTTVSTE